MIRAAVAFTIYRKELLETLRDRRTIVVMILLPLTLYPLLTLTFAQLAATQKREQGERASVVCVSGHGAALRHALLADDKLQLAAHGCSSEDLHHRDVQAVLEVPRGFEASLTTEKPLRAKVLYDETEDGSRLAADRVAAAVSSFVTERRKAMLGERGLPQALVDEAPIERRSVTTAREAGAALLSKVLPVLVIFMVVLGAFYPAIDLTAGERERGTIETLLCAPVERIEVIVGKWLATATIASLTGFLNLASMGATVGQMLHLVDAQAPIAMPWSAVAMAGVAVVPSALFFGAVFMAVASLARTYKEAQSIVMPVYLAVSLPATFAVMPGSQLTLGSALVPGTGVALLVKGIIQARLPLVPAVTALVAMLIYAAAALALAARIYASEDGLLEGAGDARPRRRLRLLFGRRAEAGLRTAPSAAEAMTLFSLMLMLLFFVATPLERHDFILGHLLTQWAILLGVTLTFLRALGVAVRPALSLSTPSLRSIVAAILMGGSAWLLVEALVEVTLGRLFPMRELAEEMRKTLMATPRPLWVNLFLFAATPALCEEILFRGAILSGLRRALRPVSAAIVCGLLFGLFHIHFLRILPTALLGVMLSWLVIGGRSIVPAMIFHFLNNGAALVVAAFGWDAQVALGGPRGHLALVVAAVVFLAGTLCLRQPRPAAAAAQS